MASPAKANVRTHVRRLKKCIAATPKQAKFAALYHQTLESYQRLICRPPPEEIWPPPAQRFGEDLNHVRINTDRYWLVPKPRLSRWAARLSRWAAWPTCDAGPPRLPAAGSLLVAGVVALPPKIADVGLERLELGEQLRVVGLMLALDPSRGLLRLAAARSQACDDDDQNQQESRAGPSHARR